MVNCFGSAGPKASVVTQNTAGGSWAGPGPASTGQLFVTSCRVLLEKHLNCLRAPVPRSFLGTLPCSLSPFYFRIGSTALSWTLVTSLQQGWGLGRGGVDTDGLSWAAELCHKLSSSDLEPRRFPLDKLSLTNRGLPRRNRKDIHTSPPESS